MKLFRIDGSLIIDNPEIDNLKELVEYCVREGISLHHANLHNTDLYKADLQNADLRHSDFCYADMRYAKFSILSFLRISICGDISDNLILELMRHDAEFTGKEKMSVWAKGGECPYKDMERDFLYDENPKLWKHGNPKLRGLDLFKAIAKELNIKHSL